MPAIANDVYTQAIEKSFRLGGQSIRYFTKPGFPAWDSISPAATLLAEHAAVPPTGRLLWLGCGHGASAAILAKRFPDALLFLMDINIIAVHMTMRTLSTNQLQNATILQSISSLPENQNAFDAVLIELPKGRKLAQRWLAEAFFALKTGGQLFLAGANQLGVQSVVQDAKTLFGPGAVLAYRKGSRILKWQTPEQKVPPAIMSHPPIPGAPVIRSASTNFCPWRSTPGISPGTTHNLSIPTPSGTLLLHTLPGVFAFDKLDEGTALLLENMPDLSGKHVCDLGCGYGVIGIQAARSGAAQVDLLDSNLLAIACAQDNLAEMNLVNARALPSDVLSAVQGQHYDCILSNPPFHTGKGVDYQVAHEFIRQSWQALLPGGEIRIVSNRFIRYESVLVNYFPHAEIVVETNQYRIISGHKQG